MAYVHRCRDLVTGQFRVVKVISREKMGPRGERFVRREVATHRMLKHPHILQLFEALETDSHVYLILELAQTELMNQLLREATRRLSEEVARRYFQQLAVAVHYCHSVGVAHRDLKPENVLVDFSDGVKLADFGMACLRAPPPTGDDAPPPPPVGGVMQHTRCGTPAYVAPEVLKASDTVAYDATISDVWSLGVILFQLVTGEGPFSRGGENVQQVCARIRKGVYQVPPDVPLSAPLRELIGLILVADPAKRATLPTVLAHPWCTASMPPPLISTLPAEPKPITVTDAAVLNSIVKSRLVPGAGGAPGAAAAGGPEVRPSVVLRVVGTVSEVAALLQEHITATGATARVERRGEKEMVVVATVAALDVVVIFAVSAGSPASPAADPTAPQGPCCDVGVRRTAGEWDSFRQALDILLSRLKAANRLAGGAPAMAAVAGSRIGVYAVAPDAASAPRAITPAAIEKVVERAAVGSGFSPAGGPGKPAKALDMATLQAALVGAEEIGRGTFGTVYRARLDGKDVAVKVSVAATKQEVEVIMSELDAMARFNHRSLVPLVGYAADAAQAKVYVVSPYFSGASLQSWLDSPSLSWRHRLLLLRDVCEGLLCLHRASPVVVHRDIKPANILVETAAAPGAVPVAVRAALADFGLARLMPTAGDAAGDGATHMSTVQFAGTPYYTAPEANQVPAVVSPASDVFSFGIVLWQMLTGAALPTMSDDAAAGAVVVGVREAARGAGVACRTQQAVKSIAEMQWVQPSRIPNPFSFPPLVKERIYRMAASCVLSERAHRPNPADIATLLQSILISDPLPTPPPDCLMCLSRPRALAAMPCGHVFICAACRPRSAQLRGCPLCRSGVEGFGAAAAAAVAGTLEVGVGGSTGGFGGAGDASPRGGGGGGGGGEANGVGSVPMRQLGPFGTTEVVSSSITITFDIDAETYEVTGPDAAVAFVRSLHGGVAPKAPHGRISYSRTVSVDVATKHAAGIPSDAWFYAFLYPVDAPIPDGKMVDPNNAVHALLTVGGFAYFDLAYNLVCLTALTAGTALQFHGPYELSPHYQVRLQSRARPVSLRALRDIGARAFAWLPGGERIGPASVPHGAFAYIFKNELMIYFALFDSEGRASTASAASPPAHRAVVSGRAPHRTTPSAGAPDLALTLSPSAPKALEVLTVQRAADGDQSPSQPAAGGGAMAEFLFVAELAHGRHSRVVLACEAQSRTMFAVKAVGRAAAAAKRATFGVGPAVGGRGMLAEALVLRQVRHPAVVALREVVDDEADAQVYLALEWLRGGPVMQLRADGHGVPPFASPTATVQRMGAALATALECLHALGVAHRSVSPENVLVGEGGVKLADFSCAHPTSEPISTATDLAERNAHLLAPEEIDPSRAPGGLSGPAIDMWGLGVTLYAMAFARAPFAAGLGLAPPTRQQVMAAVVRDRPALDGCDPQLADLLARLLDKTPSSRISARDAAMHPFLKDTVDALPSEYRRLALRASAGGSALTPTGYAPVRLGSVIRHKRAQTAGGPP